MDFHGTSHTYECIPPVLGIVTAWEKYQEELNEWKVNGKKGSEPEEVKPVIIGLKCIPIPEVDEDVFKEAKVRSEKTPEEAQRIIAGFTKERIKSKVVSIKNLVIDGEEVTDFDTFYDIAPPELVSWVCKVIYSSYMLSQAEIKN